MQGFTQLLVIFSVVASSIVPLSARVEAAEQTIPQQLKQECLNVAGLQRRTDARKKLPRKTIDRNWLKRVKDCEVKFPA